MLVPRNNTKGISMSHTIRTKAGNNKLKGRSAQERAQEIKDKRKKERALREARKRSGV